MQSHALSTVCVQNDCPTCELKRSKLDNKVKKARSIVGKLNTMLTKMKRGSTPDSMSDSMSESSSKTSERAPLLPKIDTVSAIDLSVKNVEKKEGGRR